MKKLIYIFAALIALSSCTADDTDNPAKPVDESKKYLSFTIRNESSATTGTRSAPLALTRGVAGDAAYNEDVIDFDGTTSKDVHIFFYETNQTNCIFYPEAERLSLEDGTEPGTKVIRIKLAKEDGDPFENFNPMDLISHNTVMYVVANSGLDRSSFVTGSGASETVLPLVDVMAVTVESQFNRTEGDGTITKQEKFVMQARQNVYIAGWNDVAIMTLERVAAKVQMGINDASAPGYVAKSARVKFVNFIEKSAIGLYSATESFTPADGDYSESGFINAPLGESGVEYAEPFYSYAHDWSADKTHEPYLLLEVMFAPEATPEAAGRPYYYKIPVSYIAADNQAGAAFRNKLRRNYLYRYFVNITALGGLDPDTPQEIGANLDILQWGKEEVEVTIQKFDWLFVEQQSIVIYPVPGQEVQTYLIPYRSSSALEYTSDGPLTAKCKEFNSNSNTMVDKTYGSSAPEFPTVDLNYVVDGQRYIRVQSRTPENFVQKDITMKVQNAAHLFANISIVHYPAIYVTARTTTDSSIPSNLPGGFDRGNNFNIFTVTTLAITGDEYFAWSGLSKHYTIGDPKSPTTGKYVDNADNAWVVSPKFVIQSSRGKANGQWAYGYWGTISYESTVSRCQQYAEAGYGAGTWRIPTMAELYLISKLQSEDRSAIKGALIRAFGANNAWSVGTYLLTGEKADDRGRNAVFNMNDDKRQGQAPVNTPFVGYIHVPICVRDIYQ